MRPIRLLLDGFGCYRQATEADFSDVDLFALVGPTGSGKSTVVDGVCFALYGTVPRWGRENVIAQALAPAASACRVCLVFEAAGKRYGAVRALARNGKGKVTTREARLELLDPRVPPDAPMRDILAAGIGQVAEGPEAVKAGVEKILGLSYAHFTQSVLLPQGRFAEFLQAKTAERQDLLVELLAFGVYETIGQQARERARLAAERMHNAQVARDELADATQDAITHAADRVSELAGLAQTAENALLSLCLLRERAEQEAQKAQEAREEADLLAAVLPPVQVAGLAHRISEADRLLGQRRKQRDAAYGAETEAQQAREALPDRTRMELFRMAREEQRELALQRTRQERVLAERQAGQARQAAALSTAERELQQARDDLAKAERSHAAVALARNLRIGGDCPVCLRPVAALPHHLTPADLAGATVAVGSAEERLRREQAGYQRVAEAATAARIAVENTNARMERLSATLADAPSEVGVLTSLDEIIKSDQALGRAQGEARRRRSELSEAEEMRSSLSGEEARARAELSGSRDSVVGLGAPAIEDTDLAAAWDALTRWTQAQLAERRRRQPELDAIAASLARQVASAEGALAGLLAEHGITEVTAPGQATAAVAAYRERAANRLAALREERKTAARLDKQIRAYQETEQVATMLGNLLRANSFERWLCGEALDSLVAEASGTLMELSGGQYQLDRDDHNNLIVIDYQDAGARRPVHTLSGGETFQASLALALALSRQVIGLSAGMRDLNSMFLDEGFGTLDEDTMETVATTLERLASDSDRMVGIVTHVPALAGRVPVRFVVGRTGTTSTLRKERVE